MSFGSLLRAEQLKYRGTMTVRLAIGIPVLVTAVYFMAGLFFPAEFMQGTDQPWQLYTMRIFSVYLGFMFPLQLVILAAGVVQVDHQSDMWKHLLAQPIHRWRFFAAKWIGLVAVMTLSLAAFVGSAYGFGLVLGWIHPDTGLATVELLGRSLWVAAAAGIAALGMAAIQYVVGMHWPSVAAPLAFGIVAFVGSVIVAQADGLSLYLPHVMTPPTVGTLLGEPETWWPDPCSKSLMVCAVALAWGLFRFTKGANA